MGTLVLLILGGLALVVGLGCILGAARSGRPRTPSVVLTVAGAVVALLGAAALVRPATEPFLWAGVTWVAVAAFFAGVAYRITAWVTTPVPLSIPTTPAPTTTGGVILRVLGEVLLHRSLIRDSKYVWALSMLFHWSLVFILLRHLRYFVYPVWGWIVAIEPLGVYGGYVMPICLLLLLMRRLYHPKQIYISLLSDYVALFLLLAITCSGILMKDYVRVDLIKVKNFAYCLTTLTIPALDNLPSLMFTVHFALVLILLVYFPMSKLMHFGAATFSPSRAAKYDIKNRRYVNPWDPGPNVYESTGNTGGVGGRPLGGGNG
ncbi:MAG: respiratory nitrate reductase subunit gamma [Phycisphaerae bacterium]|nr:respiratory nitrate reductase subunit gamma [Phycisphaerae bacterium]